MNADLRSDKLQTIHSDIRGPLYEEALRMQAGGEEILRLNSGNPAAFGFTMPQSVRHALERQLDRAVGYCDLRGMSEARDAIARYHRAKGVQMFGEEDIFIGNGVSELVPMVLNALLSAGDELLVPAPCYSLWSNSAYLAGGKPVFYQCDEQAGWNPDIGDIRAKITSKTRGIVLINPNNPTGALYSPEVLQAVLQVARERDLIVFSDEIYDRLLYDGATHVATASLADDVVVVTMNGLSKSHCICGFRCGWMVISGPKNRAKGFREGIVELAAMRLCSNALMQLVIPAALEDSESTREMVSPGGRLYEQRRATVEQLGTIEGVSFVENDAAFYLFPKLDRKRFHIKDDRKFAADLLYEKKILLVPGSGFDYAEPDHFRLVMLPSPQLMRSAVSRMGEFLEGYRQ